MFDSSVPEHFNFEAYFDPFTMPSGNKDVPSKVVYSKMYMIVGL